MINVENSFLGAGAFLWSALIGSAVRCSDRTVSCGNRVLMGIDLREEALREVIGLAEATDDRFRVSPNVHDARVLDGIKDSAEEAGNKQSSIVAIDEWAALGESA